MVLYVIHVCVCVYLFPLFFCMCMFVYLLLFFFLVFPLVLIVQFIFLCININLYDIVYLAVCNLFYGDFFVILLIN